MIVTRFAPSPTGRLHLGHAFSAVFGHSIARRSGGRFLLRIDDLDQTRCKPEFVDAILADLEWLGLSWDDPPLVQSQRSPVYEAALDRLREMGLAYACYCTRSDIAAAVQAPHAAAATAYPGTCRALPDDPARRGSRPHCWRLDSARALAGAGLVSWIEEDRRIAASAEDFDDIVLARKDAPASYHLSCVMDDCAGGVSLVTRGIDLRSATPVQRLLQILLGLPEPAYRHHPLVTNRDGRRLAKRDRAPALDSLRAAGIDGRALAADLLTGQLPYGFRLANA